jgi:MerR family transcriptional regulator, thiopeptide resistance regulator
MVREAAAAPRVSPLTISKLGRMFGLARSTLLYYDQIGLLRPNRYSPAGYRLYGEDALARLTRIVELRSAGLPLETVRQILETRTPLAEALERQLTTLNRQIAELRAQQRVVVSLLQSPAAARRARALSKDGWTRMFRAIGLSDADMQRWHAKFEQSMPEAHEDFLESLGLGATEIKRIRSWSAQ